MSLNLRFLLSQESLVVDMHLILPCTFFNHVHGSDEGVFMQFNNMPNEQRQRKEACICQKRGQVVEGSLSDGQRF